MKQEMETIFRTRYVSVLAVFFGAVGAVLMFLIGAVTTIDAIVTYLPSPTERTRRP